MGISQLPKFVVVFSSFSAELRGGWLQCKEHVHWSQTRFESPCLYAALSLLLSKMEVTLPALPGT